MEIFLGKPNQEVVEWCKNHAQPTLPTPVWGTGVWHYQVRYDDVIFDNCDAYFVGSYDLEGDWYKDMSEQINCLTNAYVYSCIIDKTLKKEHLQK